MTIINTVAGSSAKLAQKEVVPTSFPTTVEPPEGYDGLSKAIVDAPANLSAENIKAGVDIAGVVGGYDNRLPEQEKSVKALSFPTDVVPDEGKTLSKATVTAPDNLAPENIRKDVGIAGVVGTYDPQPNLETVTLTPTVLPATIVADAGYDGMKQVNVEKPVNLESENIKAGVNIAGVTGTYAGVSNLKLGTTGSVVSPEHLTPDNFDGTTQLESHSLFRWNVKTVELPEGITDIGSNVLQQASLLTTVIISSTVRSIGDYTLQGCAMLQQVTVLAVQPPSLAYWALPNTETLTDIFIPKGSLTAYQASTNWARYGDKLKEMT